MTQPMQGVDLPHRMSSSSSFNKVPLAAGAGAGAGAATGMPQMSQRDSMAYQNVPSENYWPDSNQSNDRGMGYAGQDPSARKKRLWKIAAAIFAVTAIIAIVVGVVVSQVSNNGGGGDSNDNDGDATLANADDPSDFEKDERLHQSFWAFAYSPSVRLLAPRGEVKLTQSQGALPPECGASQANVTRDIQILSQLTTRLRLYGANCNTTALVLQAIQDTKVDMTVWPAIYIDTNTEANENQLQAVKEAIEDYGTDHVEGIIVGNEYILNTATTESTTSAVYLSAVQDIVDHIQEANATILAMNLDKHLPIGTSDAGSLLSTTLATGIDFFMANVHP